MTIEQTYPEFPASEGAETVEPRSQGTPGTVDVQVASDESPVRAFIEETNMSIARDVARAVYVEGAVIAPVALGLVREARASVALDGETQVVGDGSDTVAAQGQSPSGVATQPAAAIAHRHTPDRATVLSERYVMGIRWVTVPCSVCGEPLPERQA